MQGLLLGTKLVEAGVFILLSRFRTISISLSGPAGLAVKPLDLHVVSVGSIPTGPSHGEV